MHTVKLSPTASEWAKITFKIKRDGREQYNSVLEHLRNIVKKYLKRDEEFSSEWKWKESYSWRINWKKHKWVNTVRITLREKGDWQEENFFNQKEMERVFLKIERKNRCEERQKLSIHTIGL